MMRLAQAITPTALFAKRRGDVRMDISSDIDNPKIALLAEQLRRQCTAFLEPYPQVRLKIYVSRIYGDCEDSLSRIFLRNVEIGPTAEISLIQNAELIAGEMRQVEPRIFIKISAETVPMDIKPVRRRRTILWWRAND
jgi:hypothetical protein